MKATEINIIEEVELENPIFIEALPGIGHVGKLAADSMIDELDATKFAEIYSPYFPPQVFVGEDGVIENMINELYYLKDIGEDKQDFILLVGNTQGLSTEGQFEICKDILDYLKKFDIKTMYTLGGIATGQPVENHKVLGAASDSKMAEYLKEHDIELRSNDGGIIGASGLFLGLGQRLNISGACLMGETPGYFIDAESAEAILIKLSNLLNIEVDTGKLDERAEETRKMLEKAQQMEQEMMGKSTSQDVDDLRYIG
ncbi:proteasome assembly chaperone family protein [Methanobrevibacter sp. DSM 116169]|uniref:proteasome assembly chaperone family protein n=1 Tax=Methanobrevibacter sp. DSM 116169 TaxID=3242727 RepID=UPI0038FC73B9